MTRNKDKIPKHIDGSEKIIRVLFYPNNVTKNKQNIRPNAFRTPSGIDEVSVLRKDFCSLTYCKKHGKNIASSENKKAYFGFALLTALNIRNVGAKVFYTPKEENIYHADIKIGYIPKKGEQLPMEYKYKVDEMAKTAKLYIDPNPDSEE